MVGKVGWNDHALRRVARKSPEHAKKRVRHKG